MPDIVMLQMLAEDEAIPASYAMQCPLTCMITTTCGQQVTDNTKLHNCNN